MAAANPVSEPRYPRPSDAEVEELRLLARNLLGRLEAEGLGTAWAPAQELRALLDRMEGR